MACISSERFITSARRMRVWPTSGVGPHRRWLLASRTTVGVSRNSYRFMSHRTLDPTQATWASLPCAETPHSAVGRRPRLAVELPVRQGERRDSSRPGQAWARAGGRADPKTRVPGWDSVKSACIFPILGVASAWAAFVVQYVRQHAVLRRQRAG